MRIGTRTGKPTLDAGDINAAERLKDLLRTLAKNDPANIDALEAVRDSIDRVLAPYMPTRRKPKDEYRPLLSGLATEVSGDPMTGETGGGGEIREAVDGPSGSASTHPTAPAAGPSVPDNPAVIEGKPRQRSRSETS